MSASSSEHVDGESARTDVEACLRRADELKLEGNDHFRASRWSEALVAYQSGRGQLPKRKDVKKPITKEDTKDPESEDESPAQELSDESDSEANGSDAACSQARAILNANIGACYVKLAGGEHAHAVEACTEALRDDPNYIKALQRRAASNEVLDTWTSLTSAQEDYNTLLKLSPENSTQRSEIKRNLNKLQPRVEAAQKKETTEMLGKLKGLGNSILGNFGLSTDNFQFTPNGQGVIL
ncbi:TPR-like protein [Hymenopellis radicata]|nr:TPR-like protein [Hymenopellis radicata]